MMEQMETSERPATLRKYEGLGAAMAAEVMTGFWFSIGVSHWDSGQSDLLRWGTYEQ